MSTTVLHRRALLVEQPSGVAVYMFTLSPDELFEVAEISRVSRDEHGDLIGYQRPEVRRHVAEIVEYLESDAVVFPNALIIALPSTVRFKQSRGPATHDGLAASGTLEIPLPGPGEARPGWLVDGQQRALALARANRKDIAVLVTAFVADDVELQRDQFLRVNNVRPLPRGLVTELLPEISTSLSPRLSAKKTASGLVELLNRQAVSPFQGLIKRSSGSVEDRASAVVTDTVLVDAIEESLNSPAGALYPYRNLATGDTDTDGVYAVLLTFWRGVQATFPDAWGLPPAKSRLMHGAGIRSMSRLMDRLMLSVDVSAKDADRRVAAELAKVAPFCRWTEGTWDELRLDWDGLQNLQKDIRMLSNFLVRVYSGHGQSVPA